MSTPHPASGHRRRSTRPTMISHPLAYVASNPRHLAPTVGRGAPSTGDLFWTGTLFLPGERFLRRSLIRLAHEEAERSRRVPHEVPMTQAMTTKGARRAPAHAASPFLLWCKGGKLRREDQAKAPISVQRDQDQSNGGKEVTMEPRTASPQGLWQAKTNFSQDKCTRCSPSNWPSVGAIPAQYLGRGPGPLPINRTSHPQGREGKPS